MPGVVYPPNEQIKEFPPKADENPNVKASKKATSMVGSRGSKKAKGSSLRGQASALKGR